MLFAWQTKSCVFLSPPHPAGVRGGALARCVGSGSCRALGWHWNGLQINPDETVQTGVSVDSSMCPSSFADRLATLTTAQGTAGFARVQVRMQQITETPLGRRPNR